MNRLEFVQHIIDSDFELTINKHFDEIMSLYGIASDNVKIETESNDSTITVRLTASSVEEANLINNKLEPTVSIYGRDLRIASNVVDKSVIVNFL